MSAFSLGKIFEVVHETLISVAYVSVSLKKA